MSTPPASTSSWPTRLLLWAGGLAVAGLLSALALIAIVLAAAYPNLPDISDLADYRPKLPLRIYTADGELMSEFGEERRNLTPFRDIPQVMVDAVLAIEDARFFEHSGVDYIGVVRAGLANLGRAKSQGASTITMQVARNVYLSSEKTFTRKIYELLLTFKLESTMTKEQILEIYMNQIFLGNRAYGFAAASETYFGKPLKNITLAEAAMLAGLPKAPSAYNPISNPKRARLRQRYIIDRMLENGFITAEQAEKAKQQELKIKSSPITLNTQVEYAAETVRQLMYAQYGDETYTRGLNVYTTIRGSDQEVAYTALRHGIMNYERRQIYRGPEKFIKLPKREDEQFDEVIADALDDLPDNGDIKAAVVLEASRKQVVVVRQNGEKITISGAGLRLAQSGLATRAPNKLKIQPGAIVRIVPVSSDKWEITQLPEVEGAFVSMDPRDGGIRAMVGGFDFNKNKFNHVTQAWRQPGSSIKPFLYSAAFEKGFTTTTVINDAPLLFDADLTGGEVWEPKNYDGAYDGPMTLRRGLAKSKNMVSIRVAHAIGPRYVQDWLARFGFDPHRHRAYLTIALGAGLVTPLQVATAYSVFANGGHLLQPRLITKVVEQKTGRILLQSEAPQLNESNRVIDARNAFLVANLLQEVTRAGTGAQAQAQLKRPDVYGKTGTTNESMDAWFAGFQPTVAAVTWIGYDAPRKLGDRETGGGLSLPVWISYMKHALKGIPVEEVPTAVGLIKEDGEWYYEEYTRETGVASLGLDDPLPVTETAAGAVAGGDMTAANPASATLPGQSAATMAATAARPDSQAPAAVPGEKKQILDLFRAWFQPPPNQAPPAPAGGQGAPTAGATPKPGTPSGTAAAAAPPKAPAPATPATAPTPPAPAPTAAGAQAASESKKQILELFKN